MIAGVLAVASIGLLLTTALMDPGFIPRQPDDIEQGYASALSAMATALHVTKALCLHLYRAAQCVCM